MSQRMRKSQIKTIHKIQSQIQTYIYWKKYDTIVKYFKKSDFINHIYNIRLIFTLTTEGKITVKVSKLDRVLQKILEYEYSINSDCISLSRL